MRNRALTLVLDIIHVIHYLWLAGFALCHKNRKATEIWLARHLLMLLSSPVAGVIAAIEAASTQQEKTLKACERRRARKIRGPTRILHGPAGASCARPDLRRPIAKIRGPAGRLHGRLRKFAAPPQSLGDARRRPSAAANREIAVTGRNRAPAHRNTAAPRAFYSAPCSSVTAYQGTVTPPPPAVRRAPAVPAPTSSHLKLSARSSMPTWPHDGSATSGYMCPTRLLPSV